MEYMWKALLNKIQHVIAPCPDERWSKISNKFYKLWDTVHCVRVMNRKHITISPKTIGSLYHHSKGFFSLLLMVICNAQYCFTLISIRSSGSNNSNVILAKSQMGIRFDSGKMNIIERGFCSIRSWEPSLLFSWG